MRRPAPLLAAPRARLAAYAALALVGALQWSRYVQDAGALRPVLWVAAGTLTGLGLLAAGRLRPRWVLPAALGAAAAGALLAVLLSGLELRYLLPRHWDELGNGLVEGAQALNTVTLPYLGRDPWVLDTVELGGAGLCWGAAVAATWPRADGGGRLVALVLLLVLAASPVISIGTGHPVALGLALAVLTAAFLWLERLSRRPGIGIAVLAVATLAVAVPLGAAADREEPWFDYKAFSESFAGGKPVAFSWDHRYGPIDWPRDGIELFRVRSPRPFYWKAVQLGTFDGREWISAVSADPGGEAPVDDLPADWRRHPQWTTSVQVALERLRTPTVVGPGTILSVRGASRRVQEDVVVPGRWVVPDGGNLSAGDSYRARVHVPRPTPAQLSAATVSGGKRRAGQLRIHVRFRRDALAAAPRTPPVAGRSQPIEETDIQFPPFGSASGPVAHYLTLGTDGDGDAALQASQYERTWALAKRLRARSTSPYDYVLRVNAYLRSPRFRYTEVPPPPARGVAPLESFLFDTRLGYCQQFSGAMALLLRLGGIPARVAAGFSPGGLRRSTGEWIVRDTDAHSWVEAWFDGLGWVTFDPTPPQTPARSQIAAVDPARRAPVVPASAPGTGAARPPTHQPRDLQGGAAASSATPDRSGFPWLTTVAFVLLLLTVGAALGRWRALRADTRTASERALADLERALRRSGRSTPPGMTISQLERRLGTSTEAAAYLQALRATRYSLRAVQPTAAQRAALRRHLGAGLGWRGRLRALWALPPRPGERLRGRRP